MVPDLPRLTTSLSRDRGVSIFNSAGAASPQATDLEPAERQGEGSSKKVRTRVVFARKCKDDGRTGSPHLGQVSFWSRRGGMEKEGLPQQWRRTHTLSGKPAEEKMEGKARQGKGQQLKAREDTSK